MVGRNGGFKGSESELLRAIVTAARIAAPFSNNGLFIDRLNLTSDRRPFFIQGSTEIELRLQLDKEFCWNPEIPLKSQRRVGRNSFPPRKNIAEAAPGNRHVPRGLGGCDFPDFEFIL